ncbi:MAG: hypothetical protein WCF04_02675, partial [Candidatus Nanopelagicales bacterium]
PPAGAARPATGSSAVAIESDASSMAAGPAAGSGASEPIEVSDDAMARARARRAKSGPRNQPKRTSRAKRK